MRKVLVGLTLASTLAIFSMTALTACQSTPSGVKSIPTQTSTLTANGFKTVDLGAKNGRTVSFKFPTSFASSST